MCCVVHTNIDFSLAIDLEGHGDIVSNSVKCVGLRLAACQNQQDLSNIFENMGNP